MTTPTQTYGITLPITHGPQGYFNQSYSVLEQIKSNLNLLLRTKKGERRMNPEFGSGLWNIVFENNTDNISSIIESTIKSDIEQWMGYLNVEEVEINSDINEYRDKYKIGIKVKFTVPSIGLNNPQFLDVEMDANTV